jgi:gliding motility-associated lipoprotein GldH
MQACHGDVLVSQKWKWEDEQWIHGDAKTFTLEAQDTVTQYAMDLDLTWSKEYGYENLYVRTTTKFPSGKEVNSVTSLEMTEAHGQWDGDCGGSYCHLNYPLQKLFTFPEVGKYTWTIEPYMRVDTVVGIKSLEVSCRKIRK